LAIETLREHIGWHWFNIIGGWLSFSAIAADELCHWRLWRHYVDYASLMARYADEGH